MIKNTILIAVASLSLTACQDASTGGGHSPRQDTALSTMPAAEPFTDVSYRRAENYFVKNTVKQLDNPKLETAEKFNAVFGLARTMSEGSKPTEIDFSKEFVIAVILPETEVETSIENVSVQKNEKGELLISYKVVSGQKQTFTTVPNLALILDKADYGSRPFSITEQKEK
jgi:hypothetical protein